MYKLLREGLQGALFGSHGLFRMCCEGVVRLSTSVLIV